MERAGSVWYQYLAMNRCKGRGRGASGIDNGTWDVGKVTTRQNHSPYKIPTVQKIAGA